MKILMAVLTRLVRYALPHRGAKGRSFFATTPDTGWQRSWSGCTAEGEAHALWELAGRIGVGEVVQSLPVQWTNGRG